MAHQILTTTNFSPVIKSLSDRIDAISAVGRITGASNGSDEGKVLIVGSSPSGTITFGTGKTFDDLLNAESLTSGTARTNIENIAITKVNRDVADTSTTLGNALNSKLTTSDLGSNLNNILDTASANSIPTVINKVSTIAAAAAGNEISAQINKTDSGTLGGVFAKTDDLQVILGWNPGASVSTTISGTGTARTLNITTSVKSKLDASLGTRANSTATYCLKTNGNNDNTEVIWSVLGRNDSAAVASSATHTKPNAMTAAEWETSTINLANYSACSRLRRLEDMLGEIIISDKLKFENNSITVDNS